jgi:hypothetical protein
LPYKISLVQGFQIAAGAGKKTDRRLLNGSQTADLKNKNL